MNEWVNEILSGLPFYIHVLTLMYIAYVITASIFYSWHGLKHHPAYKKDRATGLMLMWVIIDLPVLFLTYAGTMLVFLIFKLLGFKMEDEK